MHALGRHLILDLKNCKHLPDSLIEIREALVDAVNASGATLVAEAFHQFTPQGITGTLVLSESHLAIHTWPEMGYVSLDLYTCGDHCDPLKAVPVLVDFFQPELVRRQYITRDSDSSDFYSVSKEVSV